MCVLSRQVQRNRGNGVAITTRARMTPQKKLFMYPQLPTAVAPSAHADVYKMERTQRATAVCKQVSRHKARNVTCLLLQHDLSSSH